MIKDVNYVNNNGLKFSQSVNYFYKWITEGLEFHFCEFSSRSFKPLYYIVFAQTNTQDFKYTKRQHVCFILKTIKIVF